MKTWFKEAAAVIAALGLAGTAAAQDVPQQQQRQQQQRQTQQQKVQQQLGQQQLRQQQTYQQRQHQIRQMGGGPLESIGAQKVRHFIQFSKVSQEQDVRVDHEHASKGFTLLWSSLNSIATQPVVGQGPQTGGGPVAGNVSQNANYQQAQHALRQLALNLEENSNIHQHPQLLKSSALAAANAIAAVQQARFPQMQSQVQQLSNIAQQFDTNEPVAVQDQQVRQFLQQSSSLIQTMAQNTWKQQGQQGKGQ